MTDTVSHKEPASFTSADIARLRRETPGARQRIHLDNAGAALMPDRVVHALHAHIELETRLGGYVAQEKVQADLEKSYESTARLLGARPDEIAYLSSATDAWDRAFYSLRLNRGDKIITAFNEYCSNFVAFLHRAQKDGVSIIVIDRDDSSALDLKALEARIDQQVKLIAISHVPSSSGQINPVAAVGRIARAHGIPYLLDACQSVGQLPVNVDDIGCDMLTGTARKFLRGPRGTGFLYIRRSFLAELDPVMLTNQAAGWTTADSYSLREDARIMEAWERNVAAQLALGAAADYLLELGIDRVAGRTAALTRYLRNGLAALKTVIPTDPGPDLCAIVTFQHRTHAPDVVKKMMEQQKIAVQVSSVDHTRLDLDARGISKTIRVSPHYYNTEDEINRFLKALDALP